MARGIGLGGKDQHRLARWQAQAADKHVGRRIREWRMMLGVSQRTLSGQIGVTSQQLRKYERGTYRISAASLYRVARCLGVGIDCFFEDPGEGLRVGSRAAAAAAARAHA
jgi:transcriptional regulator with XRE-family HTH domain